MKQVPCADSNIPSVKKVSNAIEYVNNYLFCTYILSSIKMTGKYFNTVIFM